MSTSHTLPLDMLNAGAQLANIAFNLKQRVGHVISTHDAELLDRCHRQWDAALASTAAEPAALSSQAPALDIETLRSDAYLIFDAVNADQQTRDVIEWYHSSLSVALQSRQPAAPVQHWTESEPVRLAPSRIGRVYIAGPMSGLPEFNFPAFNAEAAALRAQGFAVLNPAEHGIVDGADWADYLRHDIAGLASCERIHLLPGWSKSKGARLEHSIAVALGMVITLHPDAEPAAPVAPMAVVLASPTPPVQPEEVTRPKARDVGRFGDMCPHEHIRVGLDDDDDVYVSVWGEVGGANIEFCNPGGGGGGSSSRTRMALIALMVAMEADNAERPDKDWWARRNGAAQAEGGR